MAISDDQLTEKQRMFCREYIVDLNGAQAAIRAGYSEAAAKEQASRLLTNANVQTFVQELMTDRVGRIEVRADDILRELLRIGLSDIGKAFNENGKLLPIHEIPEDTRRVIVGFDVYEEYAGVGEDRESIGQTKKIKMGDKLRAIELLGKHIRLFPDAHEHSGPDGSPLVSGATILSPEQVEQVERIKARREVSAEQMS